MAPAAILSIESLKPLNFIGSQLMYTVGPFAEVFFSPKEYQEFAALLENREYVNMLINRIDELDDETYSEERKQARQRRKLKRARKKEKRRAMKNKFKSIFNKNNQGE
jgi:hypothetical protein